MKMLTTNTPLAVPIGSIPDAFDAVKYDNSNHANDTYIGTWMGGPLYNYGGSPGALVTMNGSGQITGETPAGSIGQIFTDPLEAARSARPRRPCPRDVREPARDPGADRPEPMVTDDYAEPREIVLDPVKPVERLRVPPDGPDLEHLQPRTTRSETSAAHMPETWRQPANPAHVNIGIMEGGKTHAAPDGTTCGAGIASADCKPGDARRPTTASFLWSKGFLAESMCGGGVFWNPDVTKDIRADSSRSGTRSGMTASRSWPPARPGQRRANDVNGGFEDEPGGCAGGAWQQTSANNRWMFHSVQGRVPIADNYFDQGSLKMVYVLDTSHLVADAEKGIENCNMTAIDPSTGIKEGLEMARIMAETVPQPDGQIMQNPATEVGDCPTLLDVLIVHDPTTGGPHWAALDDHTTSASGYPTRLTFDDYFVARTGVDGDHRLFVVDISPTGHLTYDQEFRRRAEREPGRGLQPSRLDPGQRTERR